MFKVGDVLSIDLSLYRHFMMVVGDGRVVHASKEKQMVSADRLVDVCGNRPVVHHGRWGDLPNDQIIQRAKDEIGKPYDLLKNNCEHTVRKIAGMKASSPQVKFVVGACVVGLIAFLALRQKTA